MSVRPCRPYTFALTVAAGALAVSAVTGVLGCVLADRIVAESTELARTNPSRPELAEPLP